MADNLQTQVEKLIKYGNDKFGLSETTLRGVLDNASAGGDASGSIIRTAELANTDITLSKDDTTIETKNTGAGGKVDFNVSEIGTYTLSTSAWSKEIVVEELNTIIKAYAGDLEKYSWEQIHEACQGGYAIYMWKPKMLKTYQETESIFNNIKVFITSINVKEDGTNHIKWCFANIIKPGYDINPKFGYLTGIDATSWSVKYSDNGGMKYSAMERRFKLQGEEVYSQAQGMLPEEYSGTLTIGVKPSQLCYTDQGGELCKVYDYNNETDSFTEATSVIHASSSDAEKMCKFIKGYFKSVGTIDETTFNSGYYYVFDSSYYVYTRATSYTSGTTYYGLYETLQEEGVFITALNSIRPYLVKEERKAANGGFRIAGIASFSDYANLLAVEEITGVNESTKLINGWLTSYANIFNLAGEGEKEAGFDFSTWTIGYDYLTRSASQGNNSSHLYIDQYGYIDSTAVFSSSYYVRVCFTTN